MDYTKIIEEGQLIYASHTKDTMFREWRLSRTICSIKYYNTFPLTKIDRVIMLTLEKNGRIYENQLAKILGFNIEDDFNANPKRYADKGEEAIFQGIISEVEYFGLINRNEHLICLSHIGKLALKKGVKYAFYCGNIALMESFDIEPKESAEFKMFPFREALGIISSIQSHQGLDYKLFDIPELEDNLYGKPLELVSSLSLQCNSEVNIFEAEKTTESRMGEIYVDFRLYEYEGQKYPLVFFNDKISIETNELLIQKCNTTYISRKIHLGEYLHLVRESATALDYDSMIPYKDIWNLDDFLSSNRLEWKDEKFFEEIANIANGSQWNTISSECPTVDLIPHLTKYKERFDWIELSRHFDDNYIIETAIIYPWDFESLSAERSADFVKKVIVIPELHKDIDWDWNTILSKLEDEFIINNLENIPFEMYSVSQRFLSLYPSTIVEYPDKRWDWQYISSEADLSYILNNITSFSDYIQFEMVMPRAFGLPEYVEAYCDSSAFAFSVIQKKESLQDRYSANEANYAWSIKLIDWHEQLGFVTWKSVNSVEGLECNQGISWTTEVFDHYKDRIFSVKGLNHISQSITDVVSIDQNPDFKWNWSILSGRDIITNNIDLIERHISELSLGISIPLISAENLTRLYNSADFKQKVTEQEVWDKLTNCIEKSTILHNIADPNWDWHVITKNFCATLNFVALERLNVLDKLDWIYISDNADTDKILDYLDEYVDRWNWTILTRRFEHDFIVDYLPEYFKYWDWNHIVTNVLTDEDLCDSHIRYEIAVIFSQIDEDARKGLWNKLTARYSTEDIFSIVKSNSKLTEVSVVYEWNYSDVYNRSDFDINKMLTEYKEIRIPIDWNALSSSKALNKILLWDKKVIKDFSVWEEVVLNILSDKEYQWNFKYLSTLASINWCDSILQSRDSEWDWDYLSEYSRCFSYNPKRPSEIIKHIRKFDKFIDFGILSKRQDMKLSTEQIFELMGYSWDWFSISSNRGFFLTADLVQENKNLSWDWFALSSRRECAFSPKFILDNADLPWDWQFLSKRKEIPFTADIIIKLIEKDWDWKELVRRTDLEFREEMLPKLVDKDIDWFAFSQRNDFFPTMESLKILKDKNLDWDSISKRLELPYDIIVVYKNKLNWSILTKSIHIDLSKLTVLETFKDNLDWDVVSWAKEFDPSIENLKQFKDYVNWTSICKRTDVVIDEFFLEAFENFVDWKRISQSGTIHFSTKLIDRYKNRWDWIALAENPAFMSSGVENAYKNELNLIEFYKNHKEYRYGKPFVYHFTHMFNAIEVIKSKKILSRDRAKELGLLKYDAAGSVVNRSAKAHPYARFYYRTGTQTQFYNECLGRQRGATFYSNAESNGLPMCPMPVFFKFDLQEVLAKYSNMCYYSTGNLQTNWAHIYKITDDPNNIDCVHLYSRNNKEKVVREKKQQEFLIKNEFDFSELKDYQIICYDWEETEMLKSLFKDDSICDHIYCVYDTEDVFENENPSLRFELSKKVIEISTTYQGEYIFQIESAQINKVRVNNSSTDIKAIKGHVIQLRKYVSVECGDVPFDIYYVNMNPNARSPRWLVYQYTPEQQEEKITDSERIEKFLGISLDDESYLPEELITSLELVMPKLEDLYNTRVRHYVVKKHTMLVCEQFEKYPFSFDANYMSIDLMRIVLAVHDIGKAIDRSTQHEHTLSLIDEFWGITPFTEYELNLTKVLLKNDNIGAFFQDKYGLEELKNEIVEDAKTLDVPQKSLLQYKMILYQCDISSYTKDAGGLKYLEHMFEYKNSEKIFDDKEGIIVMAPKYNELYHILKTEIYG